NVRGGSDARHAHYSHFTAKRPDFGLRPIWCCCSRGSRTSPLSLRTPSLLPALLSTVSPPLLRRRWLALPFRPHYYDPGWSRGLNATEQLLQCLSAQPFVNCG